MSDEYQSAGDGIAGIPIGLGRELSIDVKGRVRDLVPPTDLSRRRSGLMLPQIPIIYSSLNRLPFIRPSPLSDGL
jgi:hypothetical protein